MSYFLGAIFSLLFESPFFKLQSHLMKNYFMNDEKANKNVDVFLHLITTTLKNLICDLKNHF